MQDRRITIGDNDGPSHMHINTELIHTAEFIEEKRPERTSFSVQFFDQNQERILGAFFTKMYNENNDLDSERKKIYDELCQKYGLKVEF